MLAYTYIEKGKFALVEKPNPVLIEPTDAIVRVTMSSICTSDLHIKHGSVPRAVPGITVGHEMGGSGRRNWCGSYPCKARRESNRKRGDLLRRVFLLQEWLCEQLYRSEWWLGVGMPKSSMQTTLRVSEVIWISHWRLEIVLLDQKERAILLEIIEDRHNRKSIIITSQLPVHHTGTC